MWEESRFSQVENGIQSRHAVLILAAPSGRPDSSQGSIASVDYILFPST